jgi:hypothetical protein
VTLCNSPGCNIDSAQSTPLACGACKLLPRPCSPSPACA